MKKVIMLLVLLAVLAVIGYAVFGEKKSGSGGGAVGRPRGSVSMTVPGYADFAKGEPPPAEPGAPPLDIFTGRAIQDVGTLLNVTEVEGAKVAAVDMDGDGTAEVFVRTVYAGLAEGLKPGDRVQYNGEIIKWRQEPGKRIFELRDGRVTAPPAAPPKKK